MFCAGVEPWIPAAFSYVSVVGSSGFIFVGFSFYPPFLKVVWWMLMKSIPGTDCPNAMRDCWVPHGRSGTAKLLDAICLLGNTAA